MLTCQVEEFPTERYIIEIDGIAKAEYNIFVKALKAGLQLKQQFPSSAVKLRDASETPLASTH
jgi:hypothetical protein